METIQDISSRLIYGDDRESPRKLTVFEYSSIIGSRAEQISMCAKSYLDAIDEKILNSPIKIAEAEFKAGVLIRTIYRKVYIFGEVWYEVFVVGGPNSELVNFNH